MQNRPVLNWPNVLSLSRVVFLFIIAALLWMPWGICAVLAFVLFIVAAVTDWADGYVARRFNLITDFGKLMDALADKVLMVGIFIVLLGVPGGMPWWTVFLVLIVVAREFLITGLRLVAASRGVVLAAEAGGKIKTVFQIIAASFFLLSLAVLRGFGWEGWPTSVTYYLGLIFLFIATGMTVQSGYTYLSKYWHMLQSPAEGSGEGGK